MYGRTGCEPGAIRLPAQCSPLRPFPRQSFQGKGTGRPGTASCPGSCPGTALPLVWVTVCGSGCALGGPAGETWVVELRCRQLRPGDVMDCVAERPFQQCHSVAINPFCSAVNRGSEASKACQGQGYVCLQTHCSLTPKPSLRERVGSRSGQRWGAGCFRICRIQAPKPPVPPQRRKLGLREGLPLGQGHQRQVRPQPPPGPHCVRLRQTTPKI